MTYRHERATGALTDRFRYAVRAAGGGVSTAVDVTVIVQERAPVFVAPARLDFPDVALGESARRTFEIRNDGGGRIEGQLTVPTPWKLAAGDGTYALGAGESSGFTIIFTPTEDRRFNELASFSHAPESGVGLSGRGYAPIETVPRELRLEADGRTELRTGGVLLRNVSDRDRTLRLIAPPEVIIEDRVTVPAKSEIQVAMHSRAGFLGALTGQLFVVGDMPRLSVPLRVMAAPARLIVNPESIDFGPLAAGKYGRAKVTLRNIGGSPADLRVRVPEGMLIEPDPSYEAVAPGQQREFEVSYARPAATRLDDAISLESGGLTLAIPVKAEVTEGRSSAGFDPAPAPAADSLAAKISDLPPVDQVRFTQTKTRLDLTWKHAPPEVVRYALFLREIAFNPNGEAVFKYIPLPRVQPKIVRDEVQATLEGLRPGEHITLLVVGYDGAGKPTRPSAPFVVFTKPSEPLRIPWSWLAGLGIVACVVVIVRERRRVRAALDADFSRRVDL